MGHLEAKGPGRGPANDGVQQVPSLEQPQGQPQHRWTFVDVGRSWCHRLIYELLLRRTTLQPSADGRHIPLRLADASSRPPQLTDERRGYGQGYLSNVIRTSRYTVLDFFPKQLLFQFSRLGNFYFLCIGIPQTIPGISTTGNYTTILPLLFFVLLTIVKEGYDDYKRHRLDKVENACLATVLRPADDGAPAVARWWSAQVDKGRALASQWKARRKGKGRPAKAAAEWRDDEEPFDGFRWTHVPWHSIRVGDVVKLARNEDVPADMILLHADGEENLAYIETMALDGETNLKSKQVPALLADGRCATIKGLVACEAEFVVEDPNPDLYHFDGRVTVGDKTLPLTSAEVIYRGSTLRNTPRAIGFVINTGEECKSRMNANRHPRAKTPALERVQNGIVLILVAYVICLTAGCSIGYYLWRQGDEESSWYLAHAMVPPQEIIIGFAIQFNNVIPLALYVSLEIVKIGQMILLNSDVAMYDESSDTPARCNTNTILENLGQIGYIFSDKTGTLTENVMKFRKMSVAGTAWLHEADMHKDDECDSVDDSVNDTEVTRVTSVTESTKLGRFRSAKRSLDVQLTPMMTPSRMAAPVESVRAEADTPSIVLPRSSMTGRRSSSQWRSTGRPDHVQPELTTEDLIEYIRLRPHSAFSKKAVTYILALALCHTCLPEVKDGEVVDFQASSPDELALVRAAEELGFLVVQKSAQCTTLRFTYDQSEKPLEEVYQVVDVIEFSSLRKRMSIVVRRPDGRLWLICKGADSVVLPRLKMAPLAMQKAQHVRKSADMEREMIRKSEQLEPRSSFGGLATVTIRKSIGGATARGEGDEAWEKSGGVNTRLGALRPPPAGDRSQSFDIQSRVRRSIDALHSHLSPAGRAPSFDMPKRSSTTTSRPLRQLLPLSPRFPPPTPPLPEKFSFLERMGPLMDDEGGIFEQCFRHIDEFAAEGLRTLLFAHKFIPEAEYQAWKKEFLAASTSLTDRQDRIEEVAEAIEQNLDLIGASAIEDKLQKGVPETIDKLRRANIKIWMLTGDKRETAINIAHSARICRPGSDVYILDAAKGDLAGQMLMIAENLGLQDALGANAMAAASASRWWSLKRFLPFRLPTALRSPPRFQKHHTVVVIDGHTLGVIERQKHRSKQAATSSLSIFSADTDLRALFYSIIPAVDSVICCRAAPAQKALLVHSIRHGSKIPGVSKDQTPGLTLAIGDGANDLAMLAEAHVGIGVSGREGLQAARVADYSIAQFRFLSKLLLVHGRWNYVRTANFILATFWKEMFFYTPAAAYQWYCGYTGTSIYESWSLTVLNTLFTSLCVIVPGICEQDLSAELLMAVPELYAYGQRSRGLNPVKYVSWMLIAVSEGVLVWFGCWAGYGAFSDNSDTGLFAIGDLVFSVCIMWTNVKLLILFTHYKTIPVMFSFFITVGGWWAWNAFLSGTYSLTPSPYSVRGGFFYQFGRDLSWWVTVLVMVAALAMFELSYRAVRRNMSIADIWRSRRRFWPPTMWRSFCRWIVRVAAPRSKGRTPDAEEVDLDNDDEDDDSEKSPAELPADELDLALWQEIERDPHVKERLRLMNKEAELF